VPTDDFARATPKALNGLADQRREAGRAEAEAAGAATRYADGDAQRFEWPRWFAGPFAVRLDRERDF
jgi:hypothetical protein